MEAGFWSLAWFFLCVGGEQLIWFRAKQKKSLFWLSWRKSRDSIEPENTHSENLEIILNFPFSFLGIKGRPSSLSAWQMGRDINKLSTLPPSLLLYPEKSNVWPPRFFFFFLFLLSSPLFLIVIQDCIFFTKRFLLNFWMSAVSGTFIF